MNKRYEVRERLAGKLHQIWANWTAYFLANQSEENRVRWLRQINTPYSELSETEKESDRRIADQILALDGIAIVEREAKLPAFARIDVEGKPEVGRYYDGYKDGQEDMLEAGWVKEMKK